jgi:hypothetical protein
MRAGGLGGFHQRRDRSPGLAGLAGIDAVEPEHHRGIEHAAVAVADLIARAGPGREIAIPGTIDEDVGAHRLTPGLGLDHQRVDATRVMHHHAGAERMKQNIDAMTLEQVVGGDLVGRGVVGLRQNLSKDQMRPVQSAETIDPIQQIGCDAPHHAMHLAMDVGMQPAEIRHPRSRAHAAEETVALDQQRATAVARGSDRRCNAGGSAAEHDDFIFAV